MKKILFCLILATLFFQASATVTFTLVSGTCDTNRVLAIQYTGGTAPYNIQWWGGTMSGYVNHTGVTTNTDTIFNYGGGLINVYVYQTGGPLVDNGSYTQPLPFSMTFAPVATSCVPTTSTTMVSASVTVTGGTPPYSYMWYNVYTPSVTASTTNPTSLSANIYGVTVADAAGCVSSSELTGVYDTLYPPPPFTVSATTTPANCTNGTATVSVSSGAVPPLSYLWSNGATTPSISGLTMGSYNVIVTDATGCSQTGYAYVSQTVSILVNTTPTPATCIASDGAIIAFATGGTPPYAYLWSNGATTASQSGIPSGPLTVTVTDAMGCIGNGSGNITASTPVTATYAATPSSCTSPTGTATLTIAGGTPPYTNTFYTSPVQTGTTATSLAPGSYNFHIVDAMGCIRNGAVIVPPVSTLNLSFTTTPALCTLSNGAASVAVSGGTPPYTYSWNTGATTSGISSVPAGGYNVTVTDNVSCSVTKPAIVTRTSPLSAGVATTVASCIFASDGTATATPSGGTLPYTYIWSNGGTTNSISSLPSRWYNVNITDAMGCTANRSAFVGYNGADSSCFCIIKGTVYNDLNGNCVQDAGEPGLNHKAVYCSSIGTTYTNSAGEYYFIVPAGSYTITEVIESYYPLASCQLNNIPVTASSGAGCVNVVDFANTVVPIHDVMISIWDYNFPVPGNIYRQNCVITNNGTVTESNILGGYLPDGQLFGASFLPSGIFTNPGGWWYNTTAGTGLSLAPGTSQSFLLDYSVPTFIPAGTSVVFRDSTAYAAPMSNWLTDNTPWNNVNYRNTVVVASYDPNFIEVSPQGAGTPGNITYSDSVLQYTVHFQNTGTYKAQNIVVIDTLDPNLDWSSLKPVFESAKCHITLSPGGVVTYTFNNIDLPPASTHPVASNGMFTYTIKTNHGLPLGTQFKARASIYFDYNAPVLTNTTLNTLWSPTTNASNINKAHFFEVYPNPSTGSFNIDISSDEPCNASMSITDISGRVMVRKTISVLSGKQVIRNDAGQLAPGIYFVSIVLQNKVQTQKLTILK